MDELCFKHLEPGDLFHLAGDPDGPIYVVPSHTLAKHIKNRSRDNAICIYVTGPYAGNYSGEIRPDTPVTRVHIKEV